MNNESNQAGNAVWKLTAPQDQSWPRLQDNVRVDVAIVGAGFCGLSAALHLAQSGASVALLEQHSPGWGASGRNGGQVIPGLKLDPNELPGQTRLIRGSGQPLSLCDLTHFFQ